MSTLWMEIVPGPELTQVRVQKGPHRTLLRARLPHSPSDPRAVAMLCEAVALWCGTKVCAALVVEGPDIFCATRPWLNTFDTRIDLGPTPFVLAGVLALAIAIGTIAGHAFKVARANPIHALRYE